ncbi:MULTISPECIES: hydrogenase maturation protease [Nocardia]|uniref:hydrogenase maturation protease n=1 Tax=Nocardia TaxID=1817 RepID=UPI000D68CDA5|nr:MULTISPECIES: hydrogenase maturation protease [Nocardia]
MTRSRTVTIGIGNEFRRDDGVGLVVASALDGLGLADVAVLTSDGEPSDLLDIWADADLAIVIDAVLCRPATPGRVRCVEGDALPIGIGTVGSHALGLPHAVALGRALGRFPRELVVVAVEAACLDVGVGLSEPVAAAVPRAVETVLAEVNRVRTGALLPE